MRKVIGHRSKVILIFSILVLSGSPCFAESPDIFFLEGKYDKAASEATRMISARSSGRDGLYYERGLAQLKLNKFDAARADFNTVISKYPRSSRKFDACMGIGDSYFLEDNIDEAVKKYESMLTAFSRDKNIALVHYRIGSCYRKLGLNDKADNYFDKAGTMAPLSFESRMIPRAGYCQIAPPKQVLPGPKERFSVQVGSFKNRENAEKLNHKLAGDGYDSFVDYPAASLDGMYRVKIGRFSMRNEADGAAAKLRSRGYNTRICSGDARQ